MALSYAAFRRPEHSTLGDAAKRYRRDPDAFTAGVQYALDGMCKQQGVLSVFDTIDPDVRILIEDQAASIIQNVHGGRL